MTTLLAPSNLFFKECYKDLESKKKILTSFEYKWAFTTIGAVEILQSAKDLLSSILDETERNSEITTKTKIQAKPGLIPGTNKNEIELSIDKKVKKLESTYLFDKLNGDTYTFFRDAFIGQPSFNDRMASLRNYQLRMHQLRLEHMDENLFHFDPLALRLEEFMYVINEILAFSPKNPPSFETLLSFIQTNPDLAKQYGFDQSIKNMHVVYKRASKLYLA